MQQLIFKEDMSGVVIPLQPWPQKFYVRRALAPMDLLWEVRPLTFTGLFKGVMLNFITMSYWRFMYLLRKIGFLSTAEGGILSWKDSRFDFWRVRKERKCHTYTAKNK